jgi:lipid II:glycine glycyltransferase (peptidoglycan interpeptide bridge formation enzyme)
MKNDRTIRLVQDSEKELWNSVISHPLQSWEWGEFRSHMGIDVVRLGVYEKNKLIEGWQITFHAVPYTNFTIGYFPKGPLPTQQMLSELKKTGKKKNALSIQLEPDVSIDIPFTISSFPLLRIAHRALFTKYTFILDLTKSEDELLSAMHSKTRYNIRVALRHGVTITEDNSDKAFAKYLDLAEETTHRQGFYAHNRKYHKTMWYILQKAGIAHCFTATYEKQIITAWIIFTWKDTIYYPYGASSRNHREVMAPNLLLWEIVKWAKTKGFFYFDLWGAMGPDPDTKDPWYGFHRFKEGYAPSHIEYLGSFDLIVQPLLYNLFIFVDSIRWMILKIKSRI